MSTLGFILLMIGGSGITDSSGNLQVIPVIMILVGMLFLLIGYKRRKI